MSTIGDDWYWFTLAYQPPWYCQFLSNLNLPAMFGVRIIMDPSHTHAPYQPVTHVQALPGKGWATHDLVLGG